MSGRITIFNSISGAMMTQTPVSKSAIYALLAAALALVSCSQSNADAKFAGATTREEAGAAANLKLTPEEMTAAGIRAEALVEQALPDSLSVPATVRANQDRVAHVAPRVPARLVKVTAKLGDKVAAGDELAVLDSIELGEAHLVYRQAESQFALAKSDFVRASKLVADDVIPGKDFIRARSEYEKARAELRAAEDRLNLLDASHRESERGPVSQFPLRAPFAGTIIEKHAILGELAQPEKSIFTIADLSVMWVEASLFEKDLGRVRVGDVATVTVNAYPGRSFAGRLTYISSTVDKETRTVEARVEVGNAEDLLKPEMFANAAIQGGATTHALAVPAGAVVLVNGQSNVFVEKGGAFDARAVELGDQRNGAIIVKSGVSPGETVVVAGAYALKARLLKSQIGEPD